ncbi:MAG: hypothetical protein ACRD29_14305 [Acidimicrobiales bacterium]
MATESVVFTALPNGVHETGDFLRVTIFVSPRLATDGAGELPLAGGDFAAFADWPAAVADTKFAIEVAGLGPLDTEPDPGSAPPDSPTWHALFDATAVVAGEFKDLSETQFRSFPVAATSEYIVNLYRDVAETAPTDFPPATSGRLTDLVSDLGNLAHDGRRRYYPMLDEFITVHEGPKGRSWRYVDRASIGSLPDSQRTLLNFAEASRFYDRPGTRDPAGPDAVPDPPKAPPVDFHGFVAFCGDYPKLLRPLGLAIDVLVRFDPAIQPQGQIRVEVAGSRPEFEPWMTDDAARPWTRYEITDRRFLPEPREKEGDLVDGELRLEDRGRFLVNQIDVDGSTLKVIDFAGNVERIALHLTQPPTRSMTEDAASLPALRSGGFTVARDERTARLVDHLGTAAGHEDDHTDGNPTELFAEDVNRGYRLDVEDERHPGRWLSLHERTGSYQLEQPGGTKVPLPVTIPPDEGYVKGASATAVPGHDEELYHHEAMFGWEGWSLAAKRPGQAITDDAVADPVQPDDPENPYPFPLVTHFDAATGTLPRLRIGRTYRFRARAVDLAGNSVDPRELVPNHVTPPHTWWRWDPIPSPPVVPRRPFTEGESLVRMVIRSTLGELPPAYVALPRITGLAGHTEPRLAYLAANERHLAPPLGSQQLAEWHGKFDAAIGESAGPPALDAEFDIAARESGSFLQPGPNVFVVNPVDPDAATVLTPDRDKGLPLQPGEYVCHHVDQLDLPYLPDPLSAGASFTSLPGDPGPRLQPWEPTAPSTPWYDRRPLRLRIEDGSGPPVYSASDRLLTVKLAQAEMVTVRLSSFMDPADLELMGVWMNEREFVRSSPLQKSAAEQGRHWMLTPWQRLTLVHAVEKPLTAPVINVPATGVPNTGVRRAVGETFAVLSGAVANHAKSTGRLDLEAEWEEPIDDVNQPAPSTIDGHAHVADFLLQPTENNCRIDRNDAPASVIQPPTHKVRHEFRDTKHRYVTYHATATTRFREYFPPEITNDTNLITHRGGDVELNVPSSRRPEPPDVLYVVPTWTWDQRIVPGLTLPGRTRRLASTLLRTRSGGGLRVYMKRPWYTSGVDELLGVVLEDQPWLTWPLDAIAAAGVSPVAKAVAEEFAEQAFATGFAKPGGRANAALTERLLAGISSSKPRSPRLRARTSTAEATLASHIAAVAAEAAPSRLAALAGILDKFILVSGDPQKFVTHWGRDPIWGSNAARPGPYIHQFPLRVAVGTKISLLEAPGHEVAVVGHRPEFDESRKVWYCDLQLEAGSSYFPFVRLALARYQPHSIPGQHLSRVVIPDFTQLVAERTAALTRIGRSALAVSLRGPGGFTENAVDLTPIPEEQLNLSRFAVAQIERLPEGSTTDLAWTAVGDEVRLALSASGGLNDIRYSATVPLIARQPGDELRLSIREYEIFETDASERDDLLVRPISAADFAFLARPVKYRLVYADHLPL